MQASATISLGATQKEAAFFGTLLCLALLDLILLFVILNPFTRVKAVDHSSPPAQVIEHANTDNPAKPSPFRAARERTIHALRAARR